MKRLLVALLMISSVSAFADDWLFLTAAANNSGAYYGLKGSYELTTNRSGEQVAVWTEKFDDKINNQITVDKLYVRTSDCLRKQGKGVMVNLNGDFLGDFDFIFGEGSVGAYRVEGLCALYFTNLRAARDKSLPN